MNTADVVAAAEGVQVIVHAANPPGYRNWRGLALPMLRSTIAAAKAGRRADRAAGQRLQFRARRRSRDRRGRAAGPADPQGRDPRRDGEPAARRQRRRRQGADPARRRLLRAGRAQQRSRLADDAPGRPPDRRLRDRPGRCRPRLRLSAGPRRDHWPGWSTAKPSSPISRCSTSAAIGSNAPRCSAAAIRRVTGAAEAADPAVPLVDGHRASPFVETFRELLEMRYLRRRPIGLDNAKLVRLPGRRAAHAARRGDPRHAGGHGLPGRVQRVASARSRPRLRAHP